MKITDNKDKLEQYKSSFKILSRAQKTNEIDSDKALDEIRKFTKSDEIALYKLQDNNVFYHCGNSSLNCLDENLKYELVKSYNFEEAQKTCIVADKQMLVNYFPMTVGDVFYLLVMINPGIANYYEYMGSAKVSLSFVLEKQQLISKLRVDDLTGLDNRYAYYADAQKIINNPNNCFYYVFLDLFRLKYVNDNYNHGVGDNYIKIVANALKKHFGRYYYYDNIGKVQSTGNYLYRISGDEFIIMSTCMDYYQIKSRIEQANLEIKQNFLEDDLEFMPEINYGIVEKVENEEIEQLYKRADKKLSEAKKRLYKRLAIDRRQ